MAKGAASRPELSLELSGSGRLPKSARVRTRREYELVQRRGVRVHHSLFTVVCARSLRTSGGPGARFGCAVSRKVGNAVRRNRLKRLMRELFRQVRPSLPSVELVVILRPGAAAELCRGGLPKMAEVMLPVWADACRLSQKSRGRRRSGGRALKEQERARANDARRK